MMLVIGAKVCKNADFNLKCAVYLPLQKDVAASDNLVSPCGYAVTFDNSEIKLETLG